MKSLILIGCLVVSAVAQESASKPTKVFIPPPRAWQLDASLLVEPTLVTGDCLEDYARALRGGLEGRKMLVQMAQLKCIERIDGVPVAFSQGTKAVRSGEGTILMRRVAVTVANVDVGNKDLNSYLDSLEVIAESMLGVNAGALADQLIQADNARSLDIARSFSLMKRGWVIASDFHVTSKSELLTSLKPKAPKDETGSR